MDPQLHEIRISLTLFIKKLVIKVVMKRSCICLNSDFSKIPLLTYAVIV